MVEPSNFEITAMVYVTAENEVEAGRISEILLEEHLISCANIFPAVVSLYRWEGKIQKDTEAVMVLKTRQSLVEELTNRIKSLHSYSCPCIVAYSSIGGNADYFRWVMDETKSEDEND